MPWLLAASQLFDGWWNWKVVGLIVFSTMLDSAVVSAMGYARERGAPDSQRRCNRLLAGSVIGNLGERDAFVRMPGLLQGAVYALLVGLFMTVSGLDVPFISFQL